MSGHTDYYLVVHMYSAWVSLPHSSLVPRKLSLGWVWKWRCQKTGLTAKKWSPQSPQPHYNVTRADTYDSPVCRQTADSVIPSSTFVPLGDNRAEVLSHYKSRCTETPCKYFEHSKSENIRRCPYLNHCRFAHVVDGQKFTFTPRDIRRLKLASRAKKSPTQKHSPPT